jgi:FAD dependent monooxygenase
MIDRQTCVSHLYDELPDKSRIQTNKRLERIEHTGTGIRVHLADGSTEEGDMVIGADGVHSLARKLMWDYAEKFEPDSIPKTDKEVMSFGEFRGLFGVSNVPENTQLGPSDAHVTLGQDETKLLFTQKGKAYWGITFKEGFGTAEQKSRATEADIEAVVKRLANRSMAGDITLGDVWATNIRHGLLNVEEGVLSKWHAGRIVLVGDSAHKVHPPQPTSIKPVTNPTPDDSRPWYGREHCD